MKTTITDSRREYRVIGFDNADFVTERFTLATLMTPDENGTELLYTLQENIDAILDLKVGETLLTKTTRDGNENNDAIIIRRQ